MLLLGLSTGHKLGLALAVACFAGFSLVVSMLVPRWRPQFPGRGLGVFLVAIVLLFVGMLTAVEIFGKESGEAKAEARATTATTATTEKKASTRTVEVKEAEFKIQVAESSLPAGSYAFEVRNDGKVPHNLVVKSDGVNASTPNIEAGQSKSLKVDLKPGTYELYCSIPGHKQAGMDVKLTVS
jgi:uncharacterized cupredoxin-like copper-binding protein